MKPYSLAISLLSDEELEGLPINFQEMTEDWWRIDTSMKKLLTLRKDSNENLGKMIDAMEDILQQYHRFSEYDEEKHTEF